MNDVNELERNLDLLVDGELDQTARRDLLVQLNREADGWRRCAMAFLEAQSWRDELGRLAGEPRETPSPPIQGAQPRLLFRWDHRLHSRLGSMLAVAAGLLLAFTLGIEVQQRRLAGDTSPDTAQVADSTATPGRPSGTSAAPRRADALRLASDSEKEVFETWTHGDTEAIPTDVLEALQRLGHRVERHQEFWPYNLEDGRRFVVPVERLDVRYVGHSFQ